MRVLSSTALLGFLSIVYAKDFITPLIFDLNVEYESTLINKNITAVTVILKAKFYMKPNDKRQFAYNIGLFDIHVEIKGQQTSISDVAECESFQSISKDLQDPALAIYNCNGLFQKLEIKKSSIDELKIILFILATNVQVDTTKLEEKCKPFYTVNTTEVQRYGPTDTVYNVMANQMPDNSISYLIRKDSSIGTSTPSGQVLKELDDVCNCDVDRKYTGFGTNIIIVTDNNDRMQMSSSVRYSYQSFVPLKDSPQFLISEIRTTLKSSNLPCKKDLLPEFTDCDPLIMKKQTTKMAKRLPDKKIISGKRGSSAPDIVEIYKNQYCDQGHVSFMTLLLDAAITCADEKSSCYPGLTTLIEKIICR